MLDDRKLENAGPRLAGLGRKMVLHLDPGPRPDSDFSLAMCELLDGLAAVSEGKLEVMRKPSSKFPGRASFSLGNIHYLAVPLDAELEPFLGLLELASSDPPREDDDLTVATVEVLMAPTCPHCARVVGACTRVAAVRSQILLSVIDVQHFGDLSYSIKSVPAVVVDHQHTSIGPMDEGDLLSILRDRGSAGFFALSLESMIKANRIDEAAVMMASEPGHAALAALMQAGGFQERLALLMLTEEALEEDPHCLDGALPALLPLLGSEDASLRGDTADLLGKIGAPGAREALEKLLADPNEDVQEIAQESLESLRKPS